MGKVVDSELRVKGVDRLRVVDASVIPVPIAGHIQNCVHALPSRTSRRYDSSVFRDLISLSMRLGINQNRCGYVITG